LLSWDLVHRDADFGRAEQFFQGFGTRMLNEAAWWPQHRDGDGNGLYAFGNDQEKPRYMGAGFAPAARSTADQSGFDAPRGNPDSAGQDPDTQLKLQNWSLALSSLVGWQLQASAAMAHRNGDSDKAAQLLAQAEATTAAMRQKAWDASAGTYSQGLDGLFPFLTGLDSDPARARSAIQKRLLMPLADKKALPFTEEGVMVPWRALLMLKVLGLYGYHKEADDAAARLLGFFEKQPAFYSAYNAQGEALGWPGSSATAGAVMAMAMQRYQAESFLLPDTRSLVGRLLQVRSPDGSLFIKVLPPQDKDPYSLISVASPEGGAIMQENAMILTADKDVTLSFVSSFPVDVKQIDHSSWDKNQKSFQMNLKAKKRYLVKFHRSTTAAP
jgi:hypothetical protein